MKNKITTAVIIIATVVLAGVAIFTAVRLYQLRQESITPIAPTSKPKADVCPGPGACTALTFNLTTGSPTPTPTATPTGSPTPTPTGTPTATPTSTPTATQPSLPDAGTSLPTIFGIGLGSLLLIGALILALWQPAKSAKSVYSVNSVNQQVGLSALKHWLTEYTEFYRSAGIISPIFLKRI